MLFRSLCFALFGKAFRNINKPNLLNSINGKDCVVEVEFDSNNKSYKIIRGIKPNKFEIYCDGDLLNQDAAVRDYQEYLEKFILKLNYKHFFLILIHVFEKINKDTTSTASFTEQSGMDLVSKQGLNIRNIKIYGSNLGIKNSYMQIGRAHV